MERDYRAAARVFKALCDPNAWPFWRSCAAGKSAPVSCRSHGADPVRAILPHEGAVRVRLGGEPSGGQVDHYQLSRTGREYAVKLLLELTTPVTEQGTPLE